MWVGSHGRRWVAIPAVLLLALGCGKRGTEQDPPRDGGADADAATSPADGGPDDAGADGTAAPDLGGWDASAGDDGRNAVDALNSDGGGADVPPVSPGIFTPVPRDLSRPWPPAYGNATLVYDSGRRLVVLLSTIGDGGIEPIAPLNNWDLDLAGPTAAWTNRVPSPPPARTVWPGSRSGFGAAYDARHARTFLFGGYVNGYYQDLWEWDGAAGTWTALLPNPVPAGWPPGRLGLALAFDADRGKLVLFGGVGLAATTLAYFLFDDVWEWDPETRVWTDRTPNPRPAAWPPARQFHKMVYDPDRKRIVVFGGDGGTVPEITARRLADVWEWDGAAGSWTDRTPSPRPTSGWPSPRMEHAMAYDTDRSRVMVFSGDAQPRDLWEWNGATGAWTDRTAAAVPAGAWPTWRRNAGLTFVPGAPGGLVLYGGYGHPPDTMARLTPLNDLWRWEAPGAANR